MKLSEAIARLEFAGIDNARGEARQLFSHFGKISNAILVSTDVECSSPALLDAILRREKREPLQYIIGECAFYNEVYKVTPSVLIPRSDTEILVEYATKSIPRGARFLDLCTGSGCIAISTLANTKDTSAVAVDISKDAIEIARENALLSGVSGRIEFRAHDALSEKTEGGFFAVLSNPPYVTSEAYESLEPEIYHEPREAFLGGADGLVFYRKITELYRDSIPQDGFIGFEIGYDQGAAIAEIAKKAEMNCKIIKDYSQNDRVAILTKL